VEQSGRIGSTYLLGLDGLRAIAISLVILYHFGFDWAPGGRGVVLFFVLSGFLITRLLLREHARAGRISISRFYARRALRIFPAFYCYWLVVVVWLLVNGKTVPWGHAIASLAYTTDYFNAILGDPNTPFSHIWSLAIEEQFYLLWPILFVVLIPKPKYLALTLAGLIGTVWLWRIALTLFTPTQEGYIYAAFDTRVDHILVGCLLAILSTSGRSSHLVKHLARKTYFPIVTLVLLVLSIFGGDWLGRATGRQAEYRDVIGFAIEPIIIAVFLIQVVQLGARSPWSWLEWPPLRLIGRLSYSLYLYQQLALWSVASRLAERPPVFQFVVATAATVLLAAASYYLVERPFLLIRNGAGWSLLRVGRRAAPSWSGAARGEVSVPTAPEASG